MKHLKTFESYGGKLMYVVYSDGDKHSAWNSEKEANHQIDVLSDKGYKNLDYIEEEVEDWIENGHYYV